MTEEHEEWARVIYQSAVERWKHAEAVRMTLTGQFFVAISLVTTAWAAVFAAHPDRPILIVVAVFGLLISAVFLLIGRRANEFVATFNELMRKAETHQPVDLPHLLVETNAKRDVLNDQLPFTSGCFVLTVPSLAFLLSVALLVLAIMQPVARP